MLRNLFTLSLRNVLSSRGYSFLNIFGLSIGIACSALIFLWVENERGYDQFNLKKDRLYVVKVNALLDAVYTRTSTSGLLGPAMQSEIPGIANTCRVMENNENALFKVGERAVYSGGRYAEQSIFDMFTLPFVEGSPSTAFSQLYSIVITERAGKKMFGNEKNLVGRTVRMNNEHDYVVGGVLKDLPGNSTLQFEWLAPFKIFFDRSAWLHDWGNSSLTTYAELLPNTNPASVNQKLNNFIQSKAPTSNNHLFLFSMNNWHLYDDFANGQMTGGGRIAYVRLFSVIAWIILLIACINFMNLATARSEKRAKEVGVRKVLGAEKGTLIVQFFAEALLMSFLAGLVAIVLIIIFLPGFNSLVREDIPMAPGNPHHFGALLIIIITCGVVAASYPSLYLSSFRPIAVLKGFKIKDGGAALIRKSLVVLQFTISTILIICTVIIYQQINHVRSRDLGLRKDDLLVTDAVGNILTNFAVVKQDLENTGFVESIGMTDHPTLYGGNNTDNMTWDTKPPNSKILISWRDVDTGFLRTSGIRLLEGRNFRNTDTVPTGSRPSGMNVIITESLARMMGTGSAVGKRLRAEGDTTAATVVGVVKDIVYGDMYGHPDPVMFLCVAPSEETVLYIALKRGLRHDQAVEAITAVMKKDNPAYPFSYRFFDEEFGQMFSAEVFVSRLAGIFASLAIIISCLGLFGLAAYTAERRTREIGIRKVLGASVAGVTTLLSADFLKLVFISCLIAFPFAWWAMHNWLLGYQYRIGISWWIFAISGLTAMIIAILTVSFQSIRAAIANPVTSLRSE